MKFDITLTDKEVLQEAGKRLSQLRIGHNLTQAELAEHAGVSKRSIERLESGSGGVRLEMFVSVCLALGLVGRSELLLPEYHPVPQDILTGNRLPKRVRKKRRVADRREWGSES